MNTLLTTVNFKIIANNILSNLPEQTELVEIETELGNFTIYTDVDYKVNYSEVIGGSYEGREFEYLTKVTSKVADITEMVIIDNDSNSEYFATNAEINKLQSYLIN